MPIEHKNEHKNDAALETCGKALNLGNTVLEQIYDGDENKYLTNNLAMLGVGEKTVDAILKMRRGEKTDDIAISTGLSVVSEMFSKSGGRLAKGAPITSGLATLLDQRNELRKDGYTQTEATVGATAGAAFSTASKFIAGAAMTAAVSTAVVVGSPILATLGLFATTYVFVMEGEVSSQVSRFTSNLFHKRSFKKDSMPEIPAREELDIKDLLPLKAVGEVYKSQLESNPSINHQRNLFMQNARELYSTQAEQDPVVFFATLRC